MPRERYNPRVKLSIASGALIAACAAIVATHHWLRPGTPAQAARPEVGAVSPDVSDAGPSTVELRSVESQDAGALRASAEPPPEPAPREPPQPEPDGLEDGGRPEPIAPPGEQPAYSP